MQPESFGVVTIERREAVAPACLSSISVRKKKKSSSAEAIVVWTPSIRKSIEFRDQPPRCHSQRFCIVSYSHPMEKLIREYEIRSTYFNSQNQMSVFNLWITANENTAGSKFGSKSHVTVVKAPKSFWQLRLDFELNNPKSKFPSPLQIKCNLITSQHVLIRIRQASTVFAGKDCCSRDRVRADLRHVQPVRTSVLYLLLSLVITSSTSEVHIN